MTGVTGIALIYISRNSIVPVRQIKWVIVFVAIDADECCKIARNSMAVGAIGFKAVAVRGLRKQAGGQPQQ